jgi:hypothetical protein
MLITAAVLVVFALGFGAGRIHNVKAFEAKVAAEVTKLKAKL